MIMYGMLNYEMTIHRSIRYLNMAVRSMFSTVVSMNLALWVSMLIKSSLFAAELFYLSSMICFQCKNLQEKKTVEDHPTNERYVIIIINIIPFLNNFIPNLNGSNFLSQCSPASMMYIS